MDFVRLRWISYDVSWIPALNTPSPQLLILSASHLLSSCIPRILDSHSLLPVWP